MKRVAGGVVPSRRFWVQFGSAACDKVVAAIMPRAAIKQAENLVGTVPPVGFAGSCKRC